MGRLLQNIDNTSEQRNIQKCRKYNSYTVELYDCYCSVMGREEA